MTGLTGPAFDGSQRALFRHITNGEQFGFAVSDQIPNCVDISKMQTAACSNGETKVTDWRFKRFVPDPHLNSNDRDRY